MAKRGRPAKFDRNQAVRQAMEVFWAQGFEGTTLEDLQAAMGGIGPPSFYNAFGSKEKLFREAADLYAATIGDAAGQVVLQEDKPVRAAIEAMLRLTAESFSQPGKPHGCLLVLGAVRCAPANRGAQAYLQAIRQRAPNAIRHRLARAVEKGELSAGTAEPGVPRPSQNVSLSWVRSIPSDSALRKSALVSHFATSGSARKLWLICSTVSEPLNARSRCTL